jgi:hypothetical protein
LVGAGLRATGTIRCVRRPQGLLLAWLKQPPDMRLSSSAGPGYSDVMQVSCQRIVVAAARAIRSPAAAAA